MPDIDGIGRKIHSTLYSRSVSDKKRAATRSCYRILSCRSKRGICRLSIAPDRAIIAVKHRPITLAPPILTPRVFFLPFSPCFVPSRDLACYRSRSFLPLMFVAKERKNCGCTRAELYNYKVFKYILQRDFTNVNATNRAKSRRKGDNPFLFWIWREGTRKCLTNLIADSTATDYPGSLAIRR